MKQPKCPHCGGKLDIDSAKTHFCFCTECEAEGDLYDSPEEAMDHYQEIKPVPRKKDRALHG
jgi:hypothetical protein